MEDNEENNFGYTTGWQQSMGKWIPCQFNTSEVKEPEITDFTEAQELLAKIMSK
jgi:hypothetical protein